MRVVTSFTPREERVALYSTEGELIQVLPDCPKALGGARRTNERFTMDSEGNLYQMVVGLPEWDGERFEGAGGYLKVWKWEREP